SSTRQWRCSKMSLLKTLFHLIRQEIPRAIIPMLLMLLLMIMGFFTPLGPGVAVVSALAAGAFLAWDNTDLVPARRMNSFAIRFRYFKKNLLFHLGFGICFLIPWLNILFLSFAPVGATLFFIENEDGKKSES
ncbi:MAG: EI24 domain-containing protein, partial [Desulfobacterium sp.]